MDHEPPKTYRLTQFSLLNLVLMTTVVALGITVYLLYQEVEPLREEVKRLRDEVGELHIEDKTKLHAIRVETDNQLEWKWRVWIPEGSVYKVRSCGERVPVEGFPDDGGTVYVREPGEHVFRWVIKRDDKNDCWAGGFYHQSSSVGYDEQPWVEWGNWSAREVGVGRKTEVFEPDSPVVLIRRTYTNKNNPPEQSGFMIWLDPK